MFEFLLMVLWCVASWRGLHVIAVMVLVISCLTKLMTFTRVVLGKRGFSMVVRPSVYAQFVAGETECEIADCMQKMSSLGLHPMLAVPIEEDLGESIG